MATETNTPAPLTLTRHTPTETTTMHAKITGDRTTHPRHGVHSDILVKFSDGTEAGPFAYYGDAYEHARSKVAPQSITRRGARARAVCSPCHHRTPKDHWANIDAQREAPSTSAVTLTITACAAEQLGSHRLSPEFFTIDGREVTASADTWALIAAQADEAKYVQLPKRLAHVWALVNTPQRRHIACKAAAI
jgi:hypothetical protein